MASHAHGQHGHLPGGGVPVPARGEGAGFPPAVVYNNGTIPPAVVDHGSIFPPAPAVVNHGATFLPSAAVLHHGAIFPPPFFPPAVLHYGYGSFFPPVVEYSSFFPLQQHQLSPFESELPAANVGDLMMPPTQTSLSDLLLAPTGDDPHHVEASSWFPPPPLVNNPFFPPAVAFHQQQQVSPETELVADLTVPPPQIAVAELLQPSPPGGHAHLEDSFLLSPPLPLVSNPFLQNLETVDAFLDGDSMLLAPDPSPPVLALDDDDLAAALIALGYQAPAPPGFQPRRSPRLKARRDRDGGELITVADMAARRKKARNLDFDDD